MDKKELAEMFKLRNSKVTGHHSLQRQWGEKVTVSNWTDSRAAWPSADQINYFNLTSVLSTLCADQKNTLKQIKAHEHSLNGLPGITTELSNRVTGNMTTSLVTTVM